MNPIEIRRRRTVADCQYFDYIDRNDAERPGVQHVCYLDRSSFGVLFGEKSEPYERGASGKAHKDSCDRLFCGDVGREYCDGVYPVKRSRKRTKSGAVSNGSAFSLSKNDKK